MSSNNSNGSKDSIKSVETTKREKTEKEFQEFLLKENCFSRFVWNLKNVKCSSWDDLDEYLKGTDKPSDFLEEGFLYEETLEGEDFWININNKWQEKLKEI
jgi:hypothetical protein